MCCLYLWGGFFVLFYQFVLANSHVANDQFSESWRTDLLESWYNSHSNTISGLEICFPRQYKDYNHNIKKRDISTKTGGLHNASAYFSLEFENQTLEIDLELNHELLPDSYAVTTFTQAGLPQVHKPSKTEKNHCYYQGHVRGVNGSKVIADTCDGLRGCIIFPDDFLLIEPLKEGAHVIYRPKGAVSHEERSFFAYDNITWRKKVIIQNHTLFDTEILKFRDAFMKQTTENEKKFVELMMVADHAAFQKYSTKAAVEAHVKEIVNFVDGYYRELDIRVILSHIEVWNNGDRSLVSNDAEAVLKGLSDYRSEQLKTEPATSPWVFADTIHLLHGGDFAGNTLGVAYLGAMCGRSSVGIDQDNDQAVNVASTVAHEMGHSFGMEHDGTDCNCPERKDCIMSASTSFSRPMAWSSCSEVALQQNLNLGIGNCLYNVPHASRIVGGQQCGNDIVEQGEQCDCGYPEQCKSSCCNPRTCQFVSGAVCDAGSCCSNCQLVDIGTKCRSSANECDLPEYCNGVSPYCPDNVYKEDGTRCSGNAAACSGGVCLTLDMLCEATWGEAAGATKAEDICYEFINTRGIRHGNCGHDRDGNFIKCADENVNCGTLFCSGGRNLPLVGNLAVTLTISKTYLCKAVSTSSNKTDTMDPGLVRSGTSCGTNKQCLDQTCQNIPVLSCTKKCNRNGVCNNFGNCHCNDGYSPPHCNQSGRGGSINSGLYSSNSTSDETHLFSTINGVSPLAVTSSSSAGDPVENRDDGSTSEFSSVEIALVVMSVIVGAGVLSLGLVASLRIYKAVSSTRSRYANKEKVNLESNRRDRASSLKKYLPKSEVIRDNIGELNNNFAKTLPTAKAAKYAPSGTAARNAPTGRATSSGIPGYVTNKRPLLEVNKKPTNNARSGLKGRENVFAGTKNKSINNGPRTSANSKPKKK